MQWQIKFIHSFTYREQQFQKQAVFQYCAQTQHVRWICVNWQQQNNNVSLIHTWYVLYVGEKGKPKGIPDPSHLHIFWPEPARPVGFVGPALACIFTTISASFQQLKFPFSTGTIQPNDIIFQDNGGVIDLSSYPPVAQLKHFHRLTQTSLLPQSDHSTITQHGCRYSLWIKNKCCAALCSDSKVFHDVYNYIMKLLLLMLFSHTHLPSGHGDRECFILKMDVQSNQIVNITVQYCSLNITDVKPNVQLRDWRLSNVSKISPPWSVCVSWGIASVQSEGLTV